MVTQDSLLVTLVKVVDRLPMPMLSQKRGRGHPKVYSDRLLLKALVIMIVRHLHNVHELLSAHCLMNNLTLLSFSDPLTHRI